MASRPQPAPQAEIRRFTPSVVEGGRAKAPSRKAQVAQAIIENGQAITVPVMGRIAAGTPIAAIQNQSHTVTLSPDFIAGGEHYALEVRGD